MVVYRLEVMLEIILNNTQGSVNQNKQRIMAPMKMVIEAKKQSLLQQQQKEDAVRAMGLDPSEAMSNPAGFIAKLQALKQNMGPVMATTPPNAPQQPPAGPTMPPTPPRLI